MTQSTSRSTRLSAFQSLYLNGGWTGTDGETVSGTGSTLEYTESVRHLLPFFIETYGITSLVDAPCGDFHWFKEISLPSVTYVGVDIVPELVEANAKKFETLQRTFLCSDVTCDPLPAADLFLCRDLLLHIPIEDCWSVLRNAVSAEFKYLMFSSYDVKTNADVEGPFGYRPVNLQRPPFNLSLIHI